MKTVKSWAQYVATQILLFACLYAWKIGGVEGAGNLLQAMLWTFAAIGTSLIFMGARGTRKPRTELGRAVGICNTLVLLAALCWFGHMVLAASYAMGLFGSAVRRAAIAERTGGQPKQCRPLGQRGSI